MAQIRDGILIADAAAGTNRRPPGIPGRVDDQAAPSR
jgi:hypothetical protein